MYKVTFSKRAQEDSVRLNRESAQLYRKLTSLVRELYEHPRTGTGQVERLRHCTGEVWSRRISQKHRLVYRIEENIVYVEIISAFGHYNN